MQESEFINVRGVEFNDRFILVEETEKGVKLQATGRGFKAVRDATRNKWILLHTYSKRIQECI